MTGPLAQTTLANTCVSGPVVPGRGGGAPGPKSKPTTEASSRPLLVSVACPAVSTQGKPPGAMPPSVGSTVGPRSGTRAEVNAALPLAVVVVVACKVLALAAPASST